MQDSTSHGCALPLNVGFAASLLAALSLAAAGLWSAPAAAQTLPAIDQSFAFCTVTDTGSAQAKIWASPVFPLTYAHDDFGATRRLQVVAGDYLKHVNSLGGAGDKSCSMLPTQAQATSSREEQRAIWNKRMFMIKVGDWREVPWTPAAWDPAAVVAATPEQVIKYFRCYVTDTDIADRSDRARTVASAVFEMPVATKDPMQVYTQASAYQEEFKKIVPAYGVAPEGTMCLAHDTRAEADKAQRDYRKMFSGFNLKFTEVPWKPGT